MSKRKERRESQKINCEKCGAKRAAFCPHLAEKIAALEEKLRREKNTVQALTDHVEQLQALLAAKARQR